jgi:four helix bundle protein
MRYPLEERVISFSIRLIAELRQIKLDPYNKNIVEQLLRSGTSIGANYQEANGAVSKNEFRVKIGLCKKEALETIYWLRVLRSTPSARSTVLDNLYDESQQLGKIFTTILSRLRTVS